MPLKLIVFLPAGPAGGPWSRSAEAPGLEPCCWSEFRQISFRACLAPLQKGSGSRESASLLRSVMLNVCCRSEEVASPEMWIRSPNPAQPRNCEPLQSGFEYVKTHIIGPLRQFCERRLAHGHSKACRVAALAHLTLFPTLIASHHPLKSRACTVCCQRLDHIVYNCNGSVVEHVAPEVMPMAQNPKK